mmetsp:Transcript_51983/g.90739  ORF Transcript_51983/g.90739 Transcript_51983/m.90739 type:complete len:221 (-) Transcript_51983:387-1049(-)
MAERMVPLMVLRRSIAMVMGPTPPGTGVMREATSLHSLKSQSPTNLYPFLEVGSSTELIPTSMTTAPGFNQLPLTISALPTAATTMSARRTVSAMSLVRECAMVTVALRCISSSATGMPTMLERPITTASLPSMLTPLRSSSSMQPWGVQDTWKSMLSKDQAERPGAWVFVLANCATFKGCRPSTSLCFKMLSKIRCSLMCGGRGNCTKMPLILGSALSS